jgi:hypothetical protein
MIDIQVNTIAPRWLSMPEACKYSSVCRNTMKKFLLYGDIYGTQKAGKWFIDRESIDLFFLKDKIELENWRSKP